MTIRLDPGLKALANERRLQILAWLKDPTAHFRAQVDGDLVKDGVCGQLITEKLGISQPTASEHLRILADAGFVMGKKIKQWVFYRRDEKAIAAFKALMKSEI
jgi:ArsR family transcriptional regulator